MLSIDEKTEVLSSSSIFQGLSKDVVETVAGRTGEISVAGGEDLFVEGEPGDSVCIIASGELVVKKGNVVLAVLSRGDMVGEMAVLTGEVRSATVTAREDSVLLFLKAKALRLLIQQMPGVAFGIFNLLAARLRKIGDFVISLVEEKPVIAVLEVIDGSDAGKKFKMTADRVEIGRAVGSIVEDYSRCAITPPEGAFDQGGGEIVHSDGAFFLRSSEPDRPILLNGDAVEESVELSDGDTITAVGTQVSFARKGGENGN